VPSVRRCTAAAPAMRCHCNTSEPTRWRAAETPAVRHPTTPLRRLKVFSQATTRAPLRRHGVGSRLSLNMKPGADRCGPGEVYRRLLPRQDRVPLSVLLQTGSRHQARGPNASTKVEPANDRPSPRSVVIQMSTQLVMSDHRAGFRRQTAAAGPLSFKAKEFVHMLSERGTVFVLGRAPQAPEVMLDDAVQAHPGCLRLRRLWRTQGGNSTPAGNAHALQKAAEGYP